MVYSLIEGNQRSRFVEKNEYKKYIHSSGPKLELGNTCLRFSCEMLTLCQNCTFNSFIVYQWGNYKCLKNVEMLEITEKS